MSATDPVVRGTVLARPRDSVEHHSLNAPCDEDKLLAGSIGGVSDFSQG